MTTCHDSDPLKSPVFDPLREFLRARRAGAPASGQEFEEFERELRTVLHGVEKELVREELVHLDISDEQVRIGAKIYRRVAFSEATYLTAAGPISLKRHLFEAKGEHHAVCPVELRAGIVEGEYTPLAARLMARVMSEMPSDQAESLFEEFGGMKPSGSALDRLPKKLSARWEAHRKEWEAALRKPEPIPQEAASCAASLDGVLVPMNTSEARENQAASGKEPKGPADYREVGCATISFYDAEGTRLLTRRFARMPETGMTTLCDQLQAEWKKIHSLRPDLRLVRLSDGAEGNWNRLRVLKAKKATEIEDFFHAAEHLQVGADAVFGEGTLEAKRFFETYRQRLRDETDGVEAVIRALSYRAKTMRKGRKKVRAVLAYFRKRRRRMRYAQYQKRGLPIGTGVTEAACKTLASQRMKRSGMRWGMVGGQAVLTLRSLIQSERWPRGWTLLRASYCADVQPVLRRA